MRKQRAIVIGAGFSGLSAACTLAHQGFKVDVFEKNNQPGGRARTFTKEAFKFDMGPSWYWMPDVFESFFNQFGNSVSNFYSLQRLDPSYRVYHGKNDFWDIPANEKEQAAFFESIESGSSAKINQFLKEAEEKYKVGMKDLVYKPGLSITEFFDARVIKGAFKLNLLQSISQHIRKFVKHPKLIQLLEFPVLFLGALPQETPALYSMMNYADMRLGTWYPKGGMHSIAQAMEKQAKDLGVTFHYNSPITQLVIKKNEVKEAESNGEFHAADVIIAGADYHHIEQKLLPENLRNYSEKYWEQKTMAPSSLIYFVGISKKLKGLLHHNLFFDTDFGLHGHEIYKDPKWPKKPLFYVSCTSKSDDYVAPDGMENLFILIPVAAGLKDTDEIKQKYFQIVIQRMEELTGQSIKEHIIVNESFAYRDFVGDYNSFKGNAYGLANTLKQTAILKPSIKNKKINNLFYTGQLTVPGPGVPPSIISGTVVAREVIKQRKKILHENFV